MIWSGVPQLSGACTESSYICSHHSDRWRLIGLLTWTLLLTEADLAAAKAKHPKLCAPNSVILKENNQLLSGELITLRLSCLKEANIYPHQDWNILFAYPVYSTLISVTIQGLNINIWSTAMRSNIMPWNKAKQACSGHITIVKWVVGSTDPTRFIQDVLAWWSSGMTFWRGSCVSKACLSQYRINFLYRVLYHQ